MKQARRGRERKEKKQAEWRVECAEGVGQSVGMQHIHQHHFIKRINVMADAEAVADAAATVVAAAVLAVAVVHIVAAVVAAVVAVVAALLAIAAAEVEHQNRWPSLAHNGCWRH